MSDVFIMYHIIICITILSSHKVCTTKTLFHKNIITYNSWSDEVCTILFFLKNMHFFNFLLILKYWNFFWLEAECTMSHTVLLHISKYNTRTRFTILYVIFFYFRRAFQRFYQKFIETAYPIEDIYIE